MNVEIHTFSLPLADPLETARGTIETRDGFLVRLEDDAGTVGVGEATPLPGWTEHYDECETVLRNVASEMQRISTTRGDTASGLSEDDDPADLLAGVDDAPAARHALDLGLADLRASREGDPLYRFLGAPERVESVPVNATVGDAGVEETVAEAEQAVDGGFDCLKLKVGARQLSADIERVEAVSEAVGADLRADANGAWTRQQAQQFLDAVGDRLAYVEQPLPATDLAGLSALSGPVALDETVAEVGFEDALEVAPEAVVCKPMALGGPRRTVELARRAREEGVVPVVTTTIDGAVARTAAVHVAAAIPAVPACGLATANLLESDLGPDIAPVADGRVVVPQDAGNGTADTWGYHA